MLLEMYNRDKNIVFRAPEHQYINFKYMSKYYIVVLGILISTLFSCQKNSIKLTQYFDNNTWNSFKNVELKSKIDNSKTYEIKVVITLTQDFDLPNFSFVLSQNSEEGESIYSNYSIPIKSKTGEFSVNPQNGYYKYSVIIRKKSVFNSKGEYTFLFENIMNKFDVKGVNSIELQLTEL